METAINQWRGRCPAPYFTLAECMEPNFPVSQSGRIVSIAGRLGNRTKEITQGDSTRICHGLTDFSREEDVLLTMFGPLVPQRTYREGDNVFLELCTLKEYRGSRTLMMSNSQDKGLHLITIWGGSVQYQSKVGIATPLFVQEYGAILAGLNSTMSPGPLPDIAHNFPPSTSEPVVFKTPSAKSMSKSKPAVHQPPKPIAALSVSSVNKDTRTFVFDNQAYTFSSPLKLARTVPNIIGIGKLICFTKDGHRSVDIQFYDGPCKIQLDIVDCGILELNPFVRKGCFFKVGAYSFNLKASRITLSAPQNHKCFEVIPLAHPVVQEAVRRNWIKAD